MIVATYRDEEAGPQTALGAALAAGELAEPDLRVELRGLDRAELTALVDMLAPDLDPRVDIAALADLTDGNPLFVREVIRELTENPGDAPLAELAPDGMRTLVGAQLQRLSAEAREVVSIASILGSDFALNLLAATAEMSETAVLTALDEALATRLVLETATLDVFTFSQPLVRNIISSLLPAHWRVRFHLRAGEALAVSPADGRWAEAACHFLAVLPLGDAAQAARFAKRAGDDAAARFAHDDAAAWYRDALEAGADSEWTADERGETLLALGRVIERGGDLLEARIAYVDAAVAAREAGNAALLADVAIAATSRYLTIDSFHDELRALIDEALEGEIDDRRRVTLLDCAAKLRYYDEDDADRPYAEEAIEIASRTDDLEGRAIGMRTFHRFLTKDPSGAEERVMLSRELRSLCEEASLRELIGVAARRGAREPLVVGLVGAVRRRAPLLRRHRGDPRPAGRQVLGERAARDPLAHDRLRCGRGGDGARRGDARTEAAAGRRAGDGDPADVRPPSPAGSLPRGHLRPRRADGRPTAHAGRDLVAGLLVAGGRTSRRRPPDRGSGAGRRRGPLPPEQPPARGHGADRRRRGGDRHRPAARAVPARARAGRRPVVRLRCGRRGLRHRPSLAGRARRRDGRRRRRRPPLAARLRPVRRGLQSVLVRARGGRRSTRSATDRSSRSAGLHDHDRDGASNPRRLRRPPGRGAGARRRGRDRLCRGEESPRSRLPGNPAIGMVLRCLASGADGTGSDGDGGAGRAGALSRRAPTPRIPVPAGQRRDLVDRRLVLLDRAPALGGARARDRGHQRHRADPRRGRVAHAGGLLRRARAGRDRRAPSAPPARRAGGHAGAPARAERRGRRARDVRGRAPPRARALRRGPARGADCGGDDGRACRRRARRPLRDPRRHVRRAALRRRRRAGVWRHGARPGRRVRRDRSGPPHPAHRKRRCDLRCGGVAHLRRGLRRRSRGARCSRARSPPQSRPGSPGSAARHNRRSRVHPVLSSIRPMPRPRREGRR